MSTLSLVFADYVAAVLSLATAQVLARHPHGNAVGGSRATGNCAQQHPFSRQPIDAPPDPQTLNRLFDHMQSDELLLFSTDYPHWQFEGDAALPEGMSPALVRKVMIDNPYATYGRLKQAAIRETMS